MTPMYRAKRPGRKISKYLAVPSWFLLQSYTKVQSSRHSKVSNPVHKFQNSFKTKRYNLETSVISNPQYSLEAKISPESRSKLLATFIPQSSYALNKFLLAAHTRVKEKRWRLFSPGATSFFSLELKKSGEFESLWWRGSIVRTRWSLFHKNMSS